MQPPTDFTDAEALEAMQEWIVGRLIPKEACLLIVRDVEVAVKEKLMAAAKTDAQRKADERQRHKEAGRTAVTVHVRPEYVPEVRALEAKLQRRENRKRGPAP